MDERTFKRQIFVLRWLYFFYFAAFGIFATFANVYYRSLGFSGSQLGLIGILYSLAGITGAPGWGWLSDRFKNPRLLLGIAILGGTLATLSLTLTTSLAGIGAATVGVNLFTSACVPLIDSANLRLLGSDSFRYGRQRIWGSLGYIAGTSSFGVILQQSGLPLLFWGSAACLLLLLPGLALFKIPAVSVSTAPGSGVGQFFRQRAWLVFAFSLLLIGIANNCLNNYLGIYIRELGGSEALIGTAVALGVVSELPVMFFSAGLLRRFNSRVVVGAGFFFLGLRMLLYGVMPSADWILPLSLLHGLTFAMVWIGSVAYASELAPAHLKSTAQGLLTATFQASGVVAGPVNGGLFDLLGSAGLFRANGLVSFAALGLLFISRNAPKEKN